MVRKVYNVSVQYIGYDWEYDEQIIRAAGREGLGSGWGFDGRDIDFDFFQEKAARRAMARIRRQCRRMHTKVTLNIVCHECRGSLVESQRFEKCICNLSANTEHSYMNI